VLDVLDLVLLKFSKFLAENTLDLSKECSVCGLSTSCFGLQAQYTELEVGVLPILFNNNIMNHSKALSPGYS
jgi:hypothetical protein